MCARRTPRPILKQNKLGLTRTIKSHGISTIYAGRYNCVLLKDALNADAVALGAGDNELRDLL